MQYNTDNNNSHIDEHKKPLIAEEEQLLMKLVQMQNKRTGTQGLTGAHDVTAEREKR